MMPVITQNYACGICGTKYADEKRAVRCEAQGVKEPSVEVGDIVLAHSGFCWFDGDRKWVSNPDVQLKTRGAVCPNRNGNCFAACCTYAFYYVVTAIDRDSDYGSHMPRYHLLTNAMTGKSGYRGGYTFDDGHYTPRKVENPPAHVVNTSKDLIGQTAEWLLR